MAKLAFSHSPLYNNAKKVVEYWDQFKPKYAVETDYQKKWLAQSKFFDSISLQSRVCVTLWDVVSSRFIYAGDATKVLGDNSHAFINEDGIDYTFSHFPEEYLDGVLKSQTKMIEYCIKHPDLLPYHVICNLDTLYKTNKGHIHFLQQVSVVEVNKDGHPLLFLSYLYDITHLKKEPSLSIVINSPLENLIWRFNFRTKTLEKTVLSARENCVLQLLASGKQTKEIAQELNLSPHTVDTHRRNLLTKMCCIDTTALITYCKMVGLV